MTAGEYIAPADGWFVLNICCGSSNSAYVTMSSSSVKTAWQGQAANRNGSLLLPIKAGDTMTLSYDSATLNRSLQFVYAEGAV